MTNEATQALPTNPTPVEASQAPPTGETSASTVIVVIPTFNERENLETCVPRVLALGPEYRVVIVDDNSPDGTGQIADALALGCPGRIGVVHRPQKGGLGPAYVAGFQVALAANPGFVATMDADLSHDPDDLPRLVAAAADQDLALGSRYARGGATRGWPRHRRLLSRFGGRYAAMVLGVAIADLTSGFKVFRAAALRAVQPETMRADGYVFNIEITYRALQRGCSVIEVPIIFTDRVAGRSKLSRRIMAEAMIVVWRLRFARQREPVTEEHHCRTHP
jgi:dolichol-phosphate mannosyltransferase